MELNGTFDLRQTTNNTFTGDYIFNGETQTWNAYLEGDSKNIRKELSELIDTVSVIEDVENEGLTVDSNPKESTNKEIDEDASLDEDEQNILKLIEDAKIK